jgi:hypothetical protein
MPKGTLPSSKSFSGGRWVRSLTRVFAALLLSTGAVAGSTWAATIVDSDRDGLPDVWEFQNGYDELDSTDALKDLDADGLSGREEFAWGTRGDKADSDGDRDLDGREVSAGKPPLVYGRPVLSVSSSYPNHACALDDTGVVCWGANGYGQTNPPPLVNPVAVSAGIEFTCALDETGVVCWGTNRDFITTVPPLSNPVAISSGFYHACALDDTGVVCWGGSYYGQANVPPLINPVAVNAGVYSTCALDDTGVVCWGYKATRQSSAPPLSNPVAVIPGYEHTCALDDTGVVCWGNNGYGETNVPPLSNPMALSVGFQHSCSLDDTGVVCWGYNVSGQSRVPLLNTPLAVSAGADNTCALDDTGVVCWGNMAGQAAVPPLAVTPPRFYNHARTFPRMVPISDTNADSVSDLAVVRRFPLRAEIRSGANGSLIRTILLFDGKPVPLDLTTLPDTDGNGSPELAGLAWSNGAFAAQVVNVGNGAPVARTVSFSSTLKEYRGFTTAPDINGNGAPELVLMAKDAAGQTIVQLKDAATGATTATVPFGSIYDPVGIEVVEDQDGGGVPDLAMVGTNSTGRVRAQIKDPITKAVVDGIDFERTYPALHTVSLDLDGDGQNEVLGVLGENTSGYARAQLKHLPDGAAVSRAFFGRGFTAHELFTIPDQNGNGQPELVVLQSPGPKGIAHIRDAVTGALVKQVSFVTRGMPRDAVYLPPSPVPAVGEIGYLSEEAGKLTLQTRATLSGTRRLNVALSTSAPSYTVSTQASAGGSISPSSTQVQLGQSNTFTVTPDAGFGIASVTGCGGSLIGNAYTTSLITAKCTISASFTPLPAASFSASGFAVGSPAPAGTQIVVGIRLTNPDGSDPSNVAVNYTLPSGVSESGSLSCSYSSTQNRRTCSLTVTPNAAGTYNIPFTATRSGEMPVQIVVSITAT